MNKLILPFEEISSKNVDIAGGKGASLGEMTQAGIPVPPGFVILSSTFDKFIEQTDLNIEIDAILDSVNHKEIHTVENASEKIQALILESEMPNDIEKGVKEFFTRLNTRYVAVRSSATAEDSASAAWAGQLDSYLNTTEETLLENVKKCWASLFTPRAIFYRFEKKLHKQKISVAVVVQKMVQSEISGIAFSVHPVTQDRNQIIIEAGFGLGEAIVSGAVTPDSYVVEKEPRKIIDINVNVQNKALYRKDGGGNIWKDLPKEEAEKQVLSEEQILEFSEIILGIENHYNFPCDIEWAYEKGKFYIVQSRPITTLKLKTIPSNTSESENTISDLKNFKLIFSRPQSVLRDEFAYILFKNYTNIPNLRIMTIPLEGTNRAIYIDGIFLKQLFEYLLKNISTKKNFQLHLKKYKKVTKNIESLSSKIIKYTGSDKQQLIILYKKALDVVVDLGDYMWIPVPIENILTPKFIELLKEKNPNSWEEIYNAVSSPVKLYGYQKMRIAICEVVINKKTNSNKAIRKLVDLYKYQGEYSYVEPLFEEEYFKNEFAKLNIETAKAEKYRIFNEIKNNKNNFKKAISQIKDKTLLLQANIINEYTYLRTDRVDLLKKIQVPLRSILERIAKYLTNEDNKLWTRIDVASLLNSEIIDYLSGKNIPDLNSVTLRKNGVYYCTRNETKVFTDITIVEKIKKEMSTSTDTTIKGATAFKGIVRGCVKMVFSKNDLSKVLCGDILVARTTMPDYTPAMEIASAFVTEEGGITSHAAIIARELKKPCIVGTGNCTKILKDGDIVEVDADNGVVRIISK